MRRKAVWLLAMVLAAVCIETAAADSIIPPEVSEAVPPEAAQMMEAHKISALLVVDETGALVGALNFHDLLRARVV